MNQTEQQASKTKNNKKPSYPQTAVVPIANPETAPDLIRLADSLVHPDTGKVIALVVSLGDVEEADKTLVKLDDIVDELVAEGLKVSIESISASTIARGILDTAREQGADLIMMGINKQRTRGQTGFGTVVESVIETASVNVLIYRAGPRHEFERVVVPVNNSFEGKVAAHYGMRIAATFDTKMEAMYAQAGHFAQYEGLARIEQVIADLPERQRVKRTVVTAQNAVDGILARTNEDDLIVVGFKERSEFERLMFGDVARGMLNRAEGPVLMVHHTDEPENTTSRAWLRFVRWIRPALTRMEQDEIVRNALVMCSANIDYIMLILVSATLATLGLLLNSSAVIIGAMLVAPLMQPLIGLSTGLTVGRVFMARRATSTLVMGVLLSLLVSIAVGLILPQITPTPEMLARGSPTLVDAAVAIASGVIGAYATARKDIPSALAGVAIAAALMPPICTIGLGTAFRDYELAFGATVLFLTNIICIIFAGVAVFIWLGMRFQRYPEIKPWMQYAMLALLTLVALPVGNQLWRLTQEASIESVVQREIREALAPVEVIAFEAEPGTESHKVTATVRTAQPLTADDVRRVQQHVAQELGESVEIELIVQEVIRLSVEPEPEITLEAEATEMP